MSNSNILALGLGGGAAVIALAAFFGGGPNRSDIDRMIDRKAGSTEESVEALETRITQLETALEAAGASAADAEAVAAIEAAVAQVASVSESNATALGALTEQSGATEETLAALTDRVTSVEAAAASANEAAAVATEAASSAMAAAAEVSASAEAETAMAVDASGTAETDAAMGTETAGDGASSVTEEASEEAEVAAMPVPAVSADFQPGQTASYAKGGLRIFVSRVMAEEGAARLSVNGDMVNVEAGTARTVAVGDGYCRYTLEGVGAEGASLSALCGDALPEPAGMSAGETTSLADGAIRVFASRVTEDAARLSVNTELVTLALGRSVPVSTQDQDCRVAVDSIDRGHVVVSAACGDAVDVSEAVGPGQTVVLGDGAARVFVSKVTEAGEVRLAINGQALSTGMSGDSLAVGEGCSVVIEDVVDRSASFSYACGN